MKNVVWVIQQNLLDEKQIAKISQSAIDIGCTVKFVKVIPFVDDVEFNEPLDTINVIPYGSCKLSKLAYRYGWTGMFFNDNFNTEVCVKNRDDMLNDDATVMKISEVLNYLKDYPDEQRLFIRPILDLKQFAGGTETVQGIKLWMNNIHVGSSVNDAIDGDTLVSIASVKNILAEYRCFVVDRKVVSVSLYKNLGTIRHGNVPEDHPVFKLAQEKANDWLPHQTCVMDLAVTNVNIADHGQYTERFDEYKVIEFNCLNSSGFYANDILKVVTAVSLSVCPPSDKTV